MVKVIFRDKEWELRAGMTVRDAILKVGLNPEAVLAVRDGKLISEATILSCCSLEKAVVHWLQCGLPIEVG